MASPFHNFYNLDDPDSIESIPTDIVKALSIEVWMTRKKIVGIEKYKGIQDITINDCIEYFKEQITAFHLLCSVPEKNNINLKEIFIFLHFLVLFMSTTYSPEELEFSDNYDIAKTAYDFAKYNENSFNFVEDGFDYYVDEEVKNLFEQINKLIGYNYDAAELLFRITKELLVFFLRQK